jgi:hypothetical protein
LAVAVMASRSSIIAPSSDSSAWRSCGTTRVAVIGPARVEHGDRAALAAGDAVNCDDNIIEAQMLTVCECVMAKISDGAGLAC